MYILSIFMIGKQTLIFCSSKKGTESLSKLLLSKMVTQICTICFAWIILESLICYVICDPNFTFNQFFILKCYSLKTFLKNFLTYSIAYTFVSIIQYISYITRYILYIIHYELQFNVYPLGISEERVRIDREGTIHPRQLTQKPSVQWIRVPSWVRTVMNVLYVLHVIVLCGRVG